MAAASASIGKLNEPTRNGSRRNSTTTTGKLSRRTSLVGESRGHTAKSQRSQLSTPRQERLSQSRIPSLHIFPRPSVLTLDEDLHVNSHPDEFRKLQASFEHPLTVLGIENETETVPVFQPICHDLIQNLTEMEASIEDLMKWKEEFIKQNVPSSVKLEITLLFSKLFRSKSDLHQPLFEMIKQVKLFSKSWSVNRSNMINLERDYHRHYYILDVAIRKLEVMQTHIQKINAQSQLALWERFAIRLLYVQNVQGISQANSRLGTAVGSIKSGRESVIPTLDPHQDHTGTELPAAPPIELSNDTEGRDSNTKGQSDEDIAWYKLKDVIQATICNESEWRKDARQVLKAFKIILRKHNNGAEAWIKSLQVRPFLSPNSVVYLSGKSGSLLKRIKKLPLTRSLSFPNLTEFHRYERKRTEFQEWEKMQSQAMVDSFGLPVSKPSGENTIPNPLRKGVWTNSYNCFFDIDGQLKKSFESENDINAEKLEEDAESCESTPSVTGDEDDYEDVDQKYYNAIMNSQGLQNSIAEILDQAKDKKPVVIQEKDLDTIDASKETFSLKEVIELTLLHAQQLHLVKTEFDEREQELRQQIVQANNEKEIEIEKSKAKIQEAMAYVEMFNKHNDRRETTSRPSSSLTQSRSTHSSVKSQYNPATTERIPESSHVASNHSSRPSSARKAMNESTRLISTSYENERPITPKLRTTPAIPNNKPVYKSEAMKLNFFQRLDWFAKMSEQYHNRKRQEAVEKEKKENEKRLEQLKLLEDKHQPQYSLLAEFMPMPGEINMKNSGQSTSFHWSDHGIATPWGGRFKISPAQPKLNILNLFDVAMNLRPSPEENEKETEDSDDD
ncbi:hypothetical protein BC833DRAFT_623343 [Globomyces pollinis-pini]|nr:hypothetical protein BC833DRAFT_623343 [Globomyces pollinis-pini]